ncbi:MAG: 16S rRNA (cytidine(1402)-2'-O)-methyltransferase [Agromyces sp.]
MIVLAATPIGNLGDASTRLRDALEESPVIAAEDTRTTIKLLQALGIANRPQLIALHEHNERERAEQLIELAREQNVLVLSDAGMPAISDPGFVLVEAAVAAGVEVTVIPGPSAVLTALALSGLPTDRFSFEGFVPRKAGERASWFTALEHEPRTMVLFEAPHRIAESLAAARDALGADRRAAVCRELTKRYEEVRRGSLSELAEWAESGVKGEIVIVIAGAPPRTVSFEDALEQVRLLTAQGSRLKDAAAEVARSSGVSSRELYNAALQQR